MSRRLYYAGEDRNPKGPVDEAALRVLRQAGTVTDRTWVIEEGGKEWVPYAAFFAKLPPVPVRPAAPDEEPAPAGGGRALLLRRIGTAAALVLPLALVFFVLLLAVGGGIVGGQIGAAHAGDTAGAFEAGKEAGAAFGRKYGPVFLLASLALGAAASAALAFSNLLPWCRKRR